MKKLIALTAAVTAATPAMAQDGVDWSGPYIGINAGFGDGTSEHSYDQGTFSPILPNGLPAPTATWTPSGTFKRHGEFNTNGATAGIQAGYNFQIKRVVVGVEADLSTGVNGTTKGPSTEPCQASSADKNGYCTTKFKHVGSVRGRLGFTSGRALIYASGGYAYTKLNAVRPFTSVEQNRGGFIWGIGLEYALSNHLSARLDYSKVDFGNKHTYNSYPLTPAYGLPYPIANYANGLPNHNVDAKLDSLKVGISYRF